ncbi:uncharacterized protein LOC116065609 [Sander lucioperca]|uniref:uncharacterized protein LOC116065609 n=1 Tax=Sander lucioperca TaxID=283035 RepID=UPI00125DDEFA|nr:uncharacterized protein LOC116065609 [Sander lucioperca]
MQWTCKQCNFSTDKRGQLLKHYRLKHGGFTRQQPIPCLHNDCLCTFKSFNALKVHLSVWHCQSDIGQTSKPTVVFHCQLCESTEPCTEEEFFTHLRSHLKLKQKVLCPYDGCDFHSNVYSTFNAHKSRVHRGSATTHFKTGIVSNIEHQDQLTEVENDISSQDDTECEFEESVGDIQDLESQLERNLAALFLKMQTILHISESATQEVIQQINQIHLLSQPLLQSKVQEIISQHCGDVDNSIVSEVVNAVSQTNVLLKFTSTGGSLSTASRRASYIQQEFPLVMPVEFRLDRDSSVVYVPTLKMLQALLRNKDILDKVLHVECGASPEGYHSFRDGSHFKENVLLNAEEFRIALGLYIDDFEVANPLGTSKKKLKLYKADKPQIIPKTFIAKGTIVGNGHENWALLRLLPLMNVAQTLAVRHQKMMAFHLDSASFFKPSVEIDKVRTMGSYKLRIIINQGDIRKVSLDGKPETVEELKIKVKEKCKLQDDFNLMYEDPDLVIPSAT